MRPAFYAEMGELISNSGDEHFAATMLQLVGKWGTDSPGGPQRVDPG